MQCRRVLAPNPGPYTGPGTNPYLINDGERAAILDPGPIIESHFAAIERSLGELIPAAVVVSHNHSDHAPLANPLAEKLGVPSYGFAPGPDFSPDLMIVDGSTIPVGSGELVAVHTPGHTWDHMCFLVGSELYTGDHIMQGSTVILEDAAAYLDSLDRVASLGATRLRPGHGDTIEDAATAVAEYIEHRRERERQIVAAVAAGATTPAAITEAVYAGIPPELMPAATSQVRVQLQKLISEERLLLGPPSSTGMHVVVPDER
jgi:glyoxylase-like metal-dependent hydrolase (beta-lactamase superfamily II)